MVKKENRTNERRITTNKEKMGLLSSPLTFSKKLNQNPQVGFHYVQSHDKINKKIRKNKEKMGLLSFELRTYGFLRLNRKWSYKTVALFPATNAPG